MSFRTFLVGAFPNFPSWKTFVTRPHRKRTRVALIAKMRTVASFGGGLFWLLPPCHAQIDVYGALTGLNSAPGTVSFFDTQTNALVGSPVTLGSGTLPAAIFTPDGRYVYITNQSNGSVTVIDPWTRSVVSTISSVSPSTGMALSPGGKLAYVATGGSSVSIIDTATNQVIGSPIPVGGQLQSVAITPDGKYLYVASSNDQQVKVIDTATKTLVGTISGVGTNAFGVVISPDGKFAYVSNENTPRAISIIDTGTRQVVNKVNIPLASPAGIAITPDGQFIYVINRLNSVYVIDTGTRTLIATIAVGSNANISISPDGKFAYVTALNAIDIIDTATTRINPGDRARRK
jgi:YVTN family beta-propeller protein